MISYMLASVSASALAAGAAPPSGGGGGTPPAGLLDQVFTTGTSGAAVDPSDLSTMWQDAAKTIPVAADGDPVRVIVDSRGGGYEWVAPSDAYRPTYKNGTEFAFTTPYLAFNGSNILRYDNTGLNFASISLWGRFESQTAGRWSVDFPHTTTNANPYARLSIWNSGLKFEGRHNGVATTGTNTVYGTGLYPMLGNDPINGKLWSNTRQEASFTAETSITYPNNQGVLIGGNPDNAEMLVGKFFGMVIIDRPSTQNDADVLDIWNNPNKKILTDRNSVYASKRYMVTKFSRAENNVFTSKRYVVTKP